MKARLKRILTPAGPAWLIEGESLTIDETLRRPDVTELQCELTLGEPPKIEEEPTEVHSIASTALTPG